MNRIAEKIIEARLDELGSFAIKAGSEISVWLSPEDLVLDERVLWKCAYGCPGYGYFRVCPPHTIPFPEFKRNLVRYKSLLLVRSAPDKINRVVVDVEREAMRVGHYLAFGLKGGHCTLCSECVPPGSPCLFPDDARPSMEGVGIDVFSTLENAGFCEALKSREEDYGLYGLVLVC